MSTNPRVKKFAEAVKKLRLDPKGVKASSHSSAVTDFSQYEEVKSRQADISNSK